MAWHNLVNTRYFSEAAIDFRNNGGHYCLAPRGSKDYFDYWEEQEKRCLNGYRVGDIWIPGRMYWYLNFTPMWKVDDTVAIKALEENRDKRGKVSKRVTNKILDFARFSEMQFEWWRFKHIAWNGGTFMGITSSGGKHICCAKTRRAGFSYMEAADGTYNYNFIDGSKSYYFAYNEQFLIKDGILNKVQEGLDWINTYIPFWKQNRTKKNTMMHQKASYLTASGEERGSMSEIMGVIVDNPNKTRGKSGRKITFEEAGSFPGLKEALQVSMGSVSDGDFYTGQISVFGTGGHAGAGIEGLEDVFYNPNSWDMIAFPNIWEDGGNATCGYFVPCYRANFLYHDEDGNCDIQGAIASDDQMREKKRESKDPKALDRQTAEFPRIPQEAFQRLHFNGFRTTEIKAQIRKIESSESLQGLIRYGKLVRSNGGDSLGGVEFIIQSKEVAKPILEYPHKSGGEEDLTGCITICERPYRNQEGKVPEGIYQIVFDAYYKEQAEDRTSLFAAYVFKLDNNIDESFNRLPVAEFVGRPDSISTCYENLFMMADYYNCTVQGEIAGGGQGVVDYAKAHRFLHRVEFEPEMLHNKEIGSKQRNRSYLMNMNTDRKQLGMEYLIDWHKEQRGINEDLTPIYNYNRIYFVGLLREMAKLASGMNADRISSCIIAMFMLKENVVKKIRTKTTNSGFYSRTLFGGTAQQTGGVVALY